jgi:peptidyl-prolyl cis-trans isomerase D
MLSTIRGKAKSWVVKILFAFLILAFAAWGIGDIFARRDLSDPVLKVGDLQYSPAEFSQDLQRRLQTFQEQGLAINAQQFAALGGIEQILARATNRLLLEQYAEQLGLTIPQNVAIADIQTNPSFQGAGGAFDRDRFLAVLRQNAFSEAGYVALVQEELRRQQLLGPTFANVVAPKALVDRVFAYLDETRGAELLVIPDASMTGIADPDQAALEKSYQEKIGRYQRPEYRAIVVLHLTPQDFTKDANIAEDQLQAEFAARQAEFATAETRSVEQVVVQDQAAADAIVAATISGKSFADAVQEATGGAPIDLGDVAKDALPADIADATFALAADATSAPLKSAFGWHVVHVKSVTPATAKTFDKVKEQLRGDLALAQAGDAMASAVNQLDDILASGASVEDAATQMGFTAQKIDAVDASGLDRDGKDLGLSPEILQLAQQTEAGGTSLVSTLSDGSYAVVQVTSVAPAEPKPLAEVTDQVKADWLEQARRDAADAKARELAEKLKTSGDLAALGQELGLSLTVTAPFKRDKGDPDNGIDPTMAQALFGVKLGEAVTGRGADGAIVARLSAIEPAKPEEAKEQRDALAKQLAATLRNDLSAEFSAALGSEIAIERNDDVINQLLATEQ